jgi:hypothetical protein
MFLPPSCTKVVLYNNVIDIIHGIKLSKIFISDLGGISLDILFVQKLYRISVMKSAKQTSKRKLLKVSLLLRLRQPLVQADQIASKHALRRDHKYIT